METNTRATTAVPATVLPNSDNVVKARNQMAKDIQVLVSDAEELLKSTAAYSGESVNAARVKFQATLENVKGRVSAAQSAAMGKVNETAKASYDYARENPWKTAGIAVAVGLVVGVLLRKK
jgi:ElaB/YqjD/DUF883 family membrane-anchored ribosome-binding protein